MSLVMHVKFLLVCFEWSVANVTLMRVFIMLIKISYLKNCNLRPHGLNIKLVFKHG